MRHINIIIPDMQSSHCQTKVGSVVSRYHGVEVKSVRPGAINVTLPDSLPVKDLIASIENSGYRVEQVNLGPNDSQPTETFNFKTNINCSGCVAKITPYIQSLEGISHWEVNTAHQDKTLTILSNGISREVIKDTVQKAGFQINSKD